MAGSNYTFIVNTYPSEERDKQLEKCLNSIFAQTYQNFSVLIVENYKHQEKISKFLKKFSSEVKRISVINDPLKKLSYLFDIGWRKAKTELLAYVADDVTIEKDWLKVVDSNFSQDEKVGVVTGPIPSEVFPEGEMHRLYYVSQKNTLLKLLSWPYIYFSLENKPFAPGKLFESGAYSMGVATRASKNFPKQEIDLATTSAMAIKKSVLEKLCGFDQRFNFNHADGDLFIRTKKLGYKIIFDPNAVAHHFLRFGPSRNAYIIGKDTGTFYRKHIRPKSFRGIIGVILNIIILNVYWIYNALRIHKIGQLKGISGFIEGIFTYGKK